ncbi:MAG: AAA family ATPase [Bacteroidales bacterium]|nr:AAA family ATPase [Bacteroidales bacterium]
MENNREQTVSSNDIIINFLQQIPHLTPRDMVEKVNSYGYIGQEKAKKAVSLIAYRHINRLKKIYIDRINPNELPPKENALLLGQTGSGKTYLIELLLQKILSIPTVIIDITSYSETGYIGQDVVAILTRLVHATRGNYPLASIGIVCIDEFDKLSSGKNNAVFSGQGTTKDVSGMGVQRELLKMLENSNIDVPVELSHSSYSHRATINTGNIPFIACGAFSNFKSLVDFNNKNIGFLNNDNVLKHSGIAVSYKKDDLLKVSNFQSYGIMPELMGRFSQIIPFEPLSKEVLKQILINNTLKKYKKELLLEDVELIIDDSVSNKIVDEAYKRETGARGLRNSLIEFIEDACFELYSTPDKNYKKIYISSQNNDIVWKIV